MTQPASTTGRTAGGENAPPPILVARGLTRTFRMGESEVRVLRSVDLSIRPGEFLAIEGRSGSGKSTLLHILGALDAVDAGSVEFNGEDYTRVHAGARKTPLTILKSAPARVTRWASFIMGLVCLVVGLFKWHRPLTIASEVLFAIWAILFFGLCAAWVIHFFLTWPEERRSARLRNKDFGFVFQFFHLLPELTVLENTMLAPMVEHGSASFATHKAELRERALSILKDLGLDHRLRHKPSQLSGGERQRVAIARALMNRPKVLFADEPTGNLDAETGGQIMKVLEHLHQTRGQTIVMVTHDRAVAHRADRVLVLREGRLTRPDER